MNRHLPMKYIVYKICIDNLISSIEWNECFINFRIVAVYNSALFICLHIHATLVKTEYEKKKGAQALAQKHTNEKKDGGVSIDSFLHIHFRTYTQEDCRLLLNTFTAQKRMLLFVASYYKLYWQFTININQANWVVFSDESSTGNK